MEGRGEQSTRLVGRELDGHHPLIDRQHHRRPRVRWRRRRRRPHLLRGHSSHPVLAVLLLHHLLLLLGVLSVRWLASRVGEPLMRVHLLLL